MVLKGHKKEVHAVAWCPKKEASGDNRLLASASFDHTARIWDVTTGACLHIINRHTDMVYSLAWQPEIGEYLATGSNDSTVCITRVKDKQLVHEYTHPGSVFEICWHPTRNQIAVCGKPSSVNVVVSVTPTYYTSLRALICLFANPAIRTSPAVRDPLAARRKAGRTNQYEVCSGVSRPQS